MVERQLLNKIISEQKLSISGMIDPNSAKELGRILGVDAIVSGTITDLGTSLKVNARVISTETGKVFGVAGTEIVKDETVEKLMGIISTAKKEEVRRQVERKEISKEALKKVEVEKFTFELTECKMSSSGSVTCYLLITNNDQKDREFQLYADRSRIFDDFGSEYLTKEAQLANKEGMIPKSLLVSGVHTSAILSFDNVLLEAKNISLLEIYFDVGPWSDLPIIRYSPFPKASIRNIPISK